MLQASKYPEWDMKAIAQQLVGKQIAQKKLPTWFKNTDVLFPVRLSMEQCSSEAAAIYRVNSIPTNWLIDGNGIIIAKNLHGNQLHIAIDEHVESLKK